METNWILIVGFLGVAFLLWDILKLLKDIDLRSGKISDHLLDKVMDIKGELFEIRSEIGNKNDLRGSKLVDLSDIGNHLEKIENKLEGIESLVDVIRDEKISVSD